MRSRNWEFNLCHCCCCSIAKLCPTDCNPMDYSTLSPRVCSNWCPLSWWCHPTISSSATLFSSHLPSLPASGSFPVSQHFASGGQSIGASASESVLPMKKIQGWFPLGLTGLSPCCPRDAAQESSSAPRFECISSSALSLLYGPTLTSMRDDHMTTVKTIALTMDRCWQNNVSAFMLSRFVTAFLPRRKHLLISWLQSLSAVILEHKKIKSVSASTFSPSVCHEIIGLDAVIFLFWMLNFKPTFWFYCFTLIKRLFTSSSLSAIRVVSSAYLRLLIFLLAVLIPACDSSSLAFHMMYSAYKLNKQGDNIQPWHTPFPIRNQSIVPCPVLTVASWPAYRFFRRQVRWSGTPISLRIFHSLLWSTQRL